MIEKLSLENDGPDGYALIAGGDFGVTNDPDRRLAAPIPEDVLYEFLDSPAVQAALEHRAEGETIRRERAASGGQSWDEHRAGLEDDPGERAREQADTARDLARGK